MKKEIIELKDGRKITVYLENGDIIKENGIYNKEGKCIAFFGIKPKISEKLGKYKSNPFGVRGSIT